MNPHVPIAHYRITAKLGEGGMGRIWRAIGIALNRDIAIKILESFAADPDQLSPLRPRSEGAGVAESSSVEARWCQICSVEETLCVSP